MRFLLLCLVAFALALGGGAWSASVMLERFEGAGTLAAGPWQADRLAGSPTADPYSRARLARDGDLSLGLAEGIAFRANVDSAGLPLFRECTYRIAGGLPLARVWTLSAFDGAGAPISAGQGRPAVLVSANLIRDDANAAPVAVSPVAQAGNWLAVSGRGTMVVALTLYDTPASTTGGAVAVTMPTIERTGCLADG